MERFIAVLVVSCIGITIANPVKFPECAKQPCLCLTTEADTKCDTITADSDLKSLFSAKGKMSVLGVTVTNAPFIKVLPNEVFGQVSSKVFYFANTGIASVEDGAFKGSENTAETIEFNNNSLTTFNFKSIRPIVKINRIEISNDRLTRIEPEDLDDLHYLAYLVLANNSISQISKNTFTNLPLIATIDLEGNKITELVEGSLSTSKAREPVRISLSSNKIASIQEGAFYDFKCDQLNLENNLLGSLDKKVFEPLLNSFSGSLNLQGNPFKCDHSIAWLVEKPANLKRHVNFKCKENGKFLTQLREEDLQ